MNANLKIALIAGGAFGVVWLADNKNVARRAVGNVIPAYVTNAHRAALAELYAPMAGVGPRTRDNQASTRWLELNQDLLASRGASARAHLAALTKADLLNVCSRFLAAVRAGALAASADARERYVLWESQGVVPFEAVWFRLADANGTELTDLGRATAQVMRMQNGLNSGFLSSPQDLLSVSFAIGVLAAEMDGVGYLISGKPETKSITGGVAYALGESVAFVGDAAGTVVGTVAGAATSLLGDAAGAIIRSPAFWAAGFGLIAWKVIK